MTIQEAIKILEQDCPKRPHKLWSIKRKEAVTMAIEALSCSESPNRSEQLTDKEQRIFLAAMEREREVCKQVDEEWRNCREPYEDSLVMICNEIVRKVEGALWNGK